MIVASGGTLWQQHVILTYVIRIAIFFHRDTEGDEKMCSRVDGRQAVIGALLAQWAAVVSNSCKFQVATKLAQTTTMSVMWNLKRLFELV